MWTLERIQQYIRDGIEENTHLDYKGAGSLAKSGEKKKEISKDVSAFANSDGGVIIYGVREFDEPSKAHLPEKIDPVDGSEYSKEWLEQVINSTISPTIHNVRITPIQAGDNEDNQVIYVVEIPKSITVHQMNDKRYYRRYNFQSIAMEDWEIKDIINRSIAPRLVMELSLKYDRINHIYISDKENLESVNKRIDLETLFFRLIPTLRNVGTKIAKIVKCDLMLPMQTLDEYSYEHIDKSQIENESYILFERDNGVQDEVSQEAGQNGSKKYTYGPKRYDPILPGRTMKLNEIYFSYIKNDLSCKIKVVIFADDAVALEQEIDIGGISIINKK